MNLIEQIRPRLQGQSDLVLVAAVVGILLVLFTPIPSLLLDLLLILNVSFALLILLLTFYVDRPLQFSTFPSLLLIATLFRLSLNIAATRLILNEGEAGKVIGAVGEHVVAGNYVVGLIVFLVLIVVQYVVVTNGAQRVAEVAARFTLDSMPGKQMSIDADMNMGIIDEKEAQRRRKEIEKEGNFYGAMDGASKFVKGDAIAGIIIILIDIIGGLTIGIAQKGMSWEDALHTYTLLTVGDGIVTQIPALIISTGTGIIVTRAASDEVLSKEVGRQITSHPKTLLLIALGLFAVMALPGIPSWPVLLVLTVIGVLAFYGYRAKARAATEQLTKAAAAPEADLYGDMIVEPVLLEVGTDLISLVNDDAAFMDRIVGLRKQFARDMGVVLPKVKATDNSQLIANEYRISINGMRVGNGQLHPGRTLALSAGGTTQLLAGGIETREPAYGLPATWLTEELVQEARDRGHTLVDAQTVLVTHLSEVLKKYAPELLSRRETEMLVEPVRKRDRALVEELVPAVLSLSDLQKVLQCLLREDVSVRNLELIFEVLIDQAKTVKDARLLAEAVRQRLAPQICQALAGESGELFVLVLDPAVEKTFTQAFAQPASAGATLEPRFADQVLKRLATSVEKMMAANLTPVLLCGAEMRRAVRDFTARTLPGLRVIGMTEVATNVRLKSFGVVTV